MVRCSCGFQAVIRTPWTNRNPGRRFYGRPTFSPTYINFLRWLDPPMCQMSVEIIHGLLRSCNELEEILATVEEKRPNLMKCLIITWVLEVYDGKPANERVEEPVSEPPPVKQTKKRAAATPNKRKKKFEESSDTEDDSVHEEDDNRSYSEANDFAENKSKRGGKSSKEGGAAPANRGRPRKA
ncbi:hypothetical protein Tco_0698814 [Tanacetum coccineum]